MCRLTAYLGDAIPLSRLVFGGEHSLHRQSWAPREMLSGSVNADGYGVVWWDGAWPVRLARPEPIWHDPGLEGVLGAVRTGLGLAALRNVTPGIPVDRASVPPVTLDRWAFVLNGSVPRFRHEHMRRLRAGLPDALYGRLTGSSDTETLFLLAVAALRDGAGMGDALKAVVGTVLDAVGDTEECQLTLVLSDGEGIAACRASNVERTNSLYRADGAEGAPGGVMLASEPLDDGPWRPLPPHTVVELTGGGTTEVPL